jgi:hypothetical protein
MTKEIIPIERIAKSIRWIRGHKLLLDSDLALLRRRHKDVEPGC